jgi:hypothetical protein
MIKNDDFYSEYLTYLDWRLNEGQISKGKRSLLKMSKTSFDDFKKKLETDEHFNNKVIQICKSEIRDKKIDEILLEDSLNNKSIDDGFFDDLDSIEVDAKKIDNIFDDFDF